jgi:hypothetical protein
MPSWPIPAWRIALACVVLVSAVLYFTQDGAIRYLFPVMMFIVGVEALLRTNLRVRRFAKRFAKPS